MPRTAPNSRRSRRTSCSILALATVMAVGATPAAAQSFQGTGNFVNPANGTINQAVAGVTTITLNSGVQQAVINWSPNDVATNTGANIVFQPVATVANFNGPTDFAILNNVNTASFTRAVELNGTINSTVGGSQGGSVYFYAPGGFVLGGSSAFNVGSLVVSALPIATTGSTFITNFGTTNSVTFGPAVTAGAAVVNNGAINANIPAFGVGSSAGDSYVALVAPRVSHSGSIDVNGSAALVAAEAATISFSTDGLFDIQVTTGTTDAIGMDVHGAIGGASPDGVTDQQGIYLVAVPKNQLMTMVIGNGADLGFTLANTAVDDNGVVVLSAGHDIVNGQIAAKSAGHGSGTGSFWFTGAHATSNLIAEATGYADLYSTDAQASQMTTTFDSDVTVHANEHVTMNADGAGSTLTVGGNVSLSTDRTGTAGQSITAGAVSLSGWNGGALSITGTTDLSANGTGGNASSGTAGSGTGGIVSVYASNGSTLTLTNLTTSAVGTGGNGLVAGVNAGDGTGGRVSIYARDSGVLTINTPLVLDAQGYGGNASGAGLAGTGTGGVAETDILNNALLTINGDLSLLASGTGGTGESQGGSGAGGVANISSDLGTGGGSTMTVNGNTNVIADGQGGSAFGLGGIGGDALGGDAFVGASENSFVFNGGLTISASGHGGDVQTGTGGVGEGGVAGLVGNGANIHVINSAAVVAAGTGGTGDIGGDGIGGYARIQSFFDLDIDGAVFASANGNGGDGFNGNGGDGHGGQVDLTASNGDLTFGNSVFADADGNGGASGNSGSTSGDGFGGTLNIVANADGNLTLTGTLFASADGLGGDTNSFGVNGGNGTGGDAFVQAFGANASVTLGAVAFVSANGNAGSCIECSGSGIGGNGTGGSVTVQAFGAPTASLSIADNLNANADGTGGDGIAGNGGDGAGGTIYVGANDGADLQIDGTLFASAEGEGGYSFGAGNGGQGTGGDIDVAATGGGGVTIDGGGSLEAEGYGGGAGIVSTGNGGVGQGGIVRIRANGGSIKFGAANAPANLTASANGEGGFSDNATGGDGNGGRVTVTAFGGGGVHVFGAATLGASGIGGNGVTGGNATALIPPEEIQPPAVMILADGGGSVTIDGQTTLTAEASGGDGSGGNGGNAAAGQAEVIAGTGSISLQAIDASADAFGGDGGLGGNGGTGKGGVVFLSWSIDTPIAGTITAISADLSANGQGGAGGVGQSGVTGGAGGSGGAGTGGVVSAVGSAAGGMLDLGDSLFAVNGIGGSGGAGGVGSDGPGGAGGAGGAGTAGRIQLGTISNEGAATSGGGAAHDSVTATANAAGGVGGAGGSGTIGDGAGGDGGSALGGSSSFLARGVLVTADSVNLAANATGGDGGTGSLQGDGGNAATGFIGVESKDRFGFPEQRGTLQVGSITGNAIATEGTGAANGIATVTDGSFFRVVNGDATIGSFDFTISGDGFTTPVPPGGASHIRAEDGVATITGEFRFDTDGTLALFADNGSMTAGSLYLSAANFVPNPGDPIPGIIGTFFADSATILTGGNFVTTADLDIGSNLAIAAPGLIDAHNFTIDGNLQLGATSGGITVNELTTTGSVNLQANGNIQTALIDAGTSVFGRTNGTFTAPNVDAGTFIDVRSVGALTLGNLIAGDYIDLRSNAPILIQNANSGETINLQTDGTLTAGNLTAGDSVLGQAVGAINVGTISAGLVDPSTVVGAQYRASLASNANITTQAVSAAGNIGFGTPGNLVTGNLDSGAGIMALIGGNITMPTVNADDYVYFANHSMSALGGAFETFDRAPILASAPTPTGGSITLGNVVTGGDATMAAGTFISGTTINAGGDILALTSNGDIGFASLTSTAGGITLNAGGDINLTGNLLADLGIGLTAADDIAIQSATAGESIDIAAGGDVSGQNLTAGDSIEVGAVNTVGLGNLSAGLVNASTSEGADYDVKIVAGGNIVAGNIAAAQHIGLATPGTMTTEDIDAGGVFMALGHGDMSFGDATASEVFLSDFAILNPGGLTATCVGACGTAGADGVVTAPPTGPSYAYVTTDGGEEGAGQLPGQVGTNGSVYTTSEFDVAAGEALDFWFNYVTSDGSGFADYAWAALLTPSLDPVAILFTARTQPSGTIVPGQNLPGVEATLNPAAVPIIGGAPEWSPLGADSGACFAAGCGFTGWVSSSYEIADAGSYVLRFGVTNWTDTGFQSGMAFSGLSIGGVSAAPVLLTRTGGSISIGNVDTGKFSAAAGTSLTTGIIDSGGAITLDAGGAITTQNLFAGDFVLANGGSIATGGIDASSVDMASTVGNITVNGAIDSVDFVQLHAASNILTQAITAGDSIDIFSSNGGITTDNLTGAEIDLEAAGNIAFDNVDADDFDFDAGGSVTGLAITVDSAATGNAGGSVVLGNITAGPTAPVDDFAVGIAAAGNITVGNVSGVGPVGFAAQGNLTTGNLTAGNLVIALVGGNTITGSITTGGEGGGQVYMADDSMTGGGTLDDFDPSTVLALDPVATGGTITINGPVTTNLFQAAAGTNLTARAITADEIAASAGGTATVNGLWSAPLVTLASGNIDITPTGSIAAGAGGEVNLLSSNSQTMLIGDGLTGSGYALSNAEFSRVSGGEINIIAGAFPGAAANTLIGDLTITAGNDGNIRNADGGLSIMGLSESGLERDGAMRVVGDVAGTGFADTNYLAFATEHFELDAANGSIALSAVGGGLGGELDLFADTIHVAELGILLKLAANPTYSGYEQDLNEGATVQRPEGVLRVGTLFIEADGLLDLLIQNTGTFATRAGFLVRDVDIPVEEAGSPPGSINMVVNGQVVTEGGTVTGIAARDALVTPEDTGIGAFTANSTINGCPLTGACIIKQPPPPPTANVVDNQIDLINGGPQGDGEFGNEDSIDDGEEGDEGASNPISPPQPLFDTRPLMPSSDVNDPVSGTGNPALLGSAGECDDDDDNQCATKKEDGQ